WTFSDGSTFNTDSVSKTFPVTGPVTITLVNKYATCTQSNTETINVVNALAANFTASNNVGCKAPLTVQFTDHTTPTATSWLWDFGDGQTSTAQNPSHTYTSAGNFTVTLTATGQGNCPSIVTKTGAVVIQAPVADIGGTIDACVASTATFNTIAPTLSVAAPDGVASLNWSAPLSNELTSTSPTPTFSYANPGNYKLSVTINTKGGCTASATSNVQIGTPLVPAFTISPATTVCNNSRLTFTSTTVGSPQNYLWTFGDHSGNEVTGSPTATYSYTFFGNHQVTLTVTNNGCPQQLSKTVDVLPPFAHFGYALAAVGCSNRSLIQFNDSSYLGDVPTYGPVSWSWDFGDGQTASGQTTVTGPIPSISHQYPPPSATPAVYNVTLTVTQGSAPNTCSNSITLPVTIGNITPSFNSVPSGTACRNMPVTFTSTSTPLSLISTYSWQVDAQPATAPSPNAAYLDTFRINGPHSVTLIAYDLNNCPSAPVTNQITIAGPTAKFAIPASGGGCDNAPVQFTDQTIPDPASAAIVNWSWNFGDGQLANGVQNPTHAYTDTGYYQPLLTVTDNAGCIDTTSQTIQITHPLVNFGGADSFYCPGVPLNFTDSSQGYGLTYAWQFGDPASGANNMSTLPAPAHTFANSGQTYNVTLTVTDQNHCPGTKTRPVQIQSPIAAFNIYDTTGICTPLQTIFAAHSQYYDSLYWQFGDTTSSTLDSTSHFYNNFGIDTAKLFVQGPGGCLDSTFRRVLITNPNNTSSVTFSPASSCDSVPVRFNLTVPDYTTFTLYFGDNAADSSQNLTPFHMYRNPASYHPEMFLSDETGCVVGINATTNVTVLGSTPFFTINKHSFCDSAIVALTDYTISNDGLTSETYNFGDGSPSQTENPGTGSFNLSHDFNQPGIWTVSMQVSTNHLCTETYHDTVHVYETPHPVMTIPSILCAGPIQFQGSLSPTQADSILWSWNFGNGITSNDQNPGPLMPPGTFTVRLDAAIRFGCADSTSSTVTINPSPEIKGPNELTVPLGIPVTIPFTYSADVVSYNWTPTANLSCTDCANPVATVTLATTYAVTVTDANSCTATDTILIKTVCNDKNYWFPNTFSPNGDGINDYFYPRGTSLYNIQSLTIFNRWGQQVFQRMDFPANQQNLGWDGTFGGKPAPTDAYVYIAQVICENAQVITISGNVTLIR
ncbi:MAG TPA: PKD domain-containing protein, partial [Puia sp.]|nr:PKD domain-containing protein [Puia sp.]